MSHPRIAAALVAVTVLTGCRGSAASPAAPLHAACGDAAGDTEGLVQDDGGNDDLDVSLEFCTIHRYVVEAGLPWVEPRLLPDARDEYGLEIESGLADFGSGFEFISGTETPADLEGYSLSFRLPQPDCDQLVFYLLELSVDDGDVDTSDALAGDLIRRGSTVGEYRVREVLDPTGAEDCARQTLSELVPSLDGIPDGAVLERAPLD